MVGDRIERSVNLRRRPTCPCSRMRNEFKLSQQMTNHLPHQKGVMCHGVAVGAREEAQVEVAAPKRKGARKINLPKKV